MATEENWDDENQGTDTQAETSEQLEPAEIFPGYTNFDDYLKDAFDVLRAGIKAANNIPIGDNFNYYQCFPTFNNYKSHDIKRILDTMQTVVDTAGVSGNIKTRDTENKFELLIETNDSLLDRAGICMDEEDGITKNPEVEIVVSQTKRNKVNGSWNAVEAVTSFCKPDAAFNSQSVRLLAGKNVQRPQLTFKDKIDNSSKPWQPRIKDKPNSLKPLAIFMKDDEDGEIFSHPYEFELNKFEPPDEQLKKRPPISYKSLDDTPLIVIEKPQDIKILLDDLKNYQEIAVDLEHHSYRSFQGITCLMQISTKDTDYLIDTLTLRSELHELNEIFTKPSVLKVFHGADSDIQWLQRDLSLYIVNMFDTHQAAKQLNLPYLSLAYLLKRYCNVDPNKHFQLADWRIRPLPEELMKYAREDTHYLLHIKDILSNDLIDSANGQTNILKAVYDRSTDICKQVYIKPVWTEDSYMNMYRKSQKMFNNRQLYALKELHKWRDQTAREEDDSTGYVLPNHMLLNIAENLPREMQGILACCNPIPPLVRQNLLRLHKIILTAREQPLIKPILEDDLRKRLTQRNHVANSEAWIYSPHDIPSGMEPRADLPCLLDNGNSNVNLPVHIKEKHTITVFDSPPASEDEDNSTRAAVAKKKITFISPFERYKRVLPMVAEQEAKEREREKKVEEERLNKLKQEEEDTSSRIQRVYQHFKDVSKNVPQESVKMQNKNSSTVPLGEMPGRKKRRYLTLDDTTKPRKKTKEDFLTPVPMLESRVVHKFRKDKYEDEEDDDIQEVKVISGGRKKPSREENVKRIERRQKGEKKKMAKELASKGMLPAQKFDYKSVDFSSFQGGSKNPAAKQVKFQQKQNKEKRRKRKKQQLKI